MPSTPIEVIGRCVISEIGLPGWPLTVRARVPGIAGELQPAVGDVALERVESDGIGRRTDGVRPLSIAAFLSVKAPLPVTL